MAATGSAHRFSREGKMGIRSQLLQGGPMWFGEGGGLEEP